MDGSLFEAAFDYCGVAGGERVVGDVVNDYATCGYDAAVADSNSGADDYSATEPAVVANDNLATGFDGFAPFDVADGVVGRVELAVRSDFAVAANFDSATIEECGSGIDKCSFADLYHVPVVAKEWGSNVGCIGNAGDKRSQSTAVSIGVVHGRGVEYCEPLQAFVVAFLYFRGGEVV